MKVFPIFLDVPVKNHLIKFPQAFWSSGFFNNYVSTDPKGFVSNVVKDTAKDYFKEKVEIPEEDRSFSSSDGGGKGFERDFEYGGGGGKPQFDEAGMSMTAMKRGGKVKSAPKSKVSTASSRGDGIAQRGKTKGRLI